MKTSPQPAALALAFVMTLAMLLGIEQLAHVETAPAAMAQASAPHA